MRIEVSVGVSLVKHPGICFLKTSALLFRNDLLIAQCPNLSLSKFSSRLVAPTKMDSLAPIITAQDQSGIHLLADAALRR